MSFLIWSRLKAQEPTFSHKRDRMPLLVSMRKIAVWLQLGGFTFFIQGLMVPCLAIRIVCELMRIPFWVASKTWDQFWLSVIILGGCVYGLSRVLL